MSERLTVCLILEGSYPYITGGVSSWVHQLIRYLEQIDFVLYTISPVQDQKTHYELPPNVVDHKDLVLSAPVRDRTRPKNLQGLLRQITGIHETLLLGAAPELDQVIAQIPHGYSPYADGIKSHEGWKLLTSENQKKNPSKQLKSLD